VAVVESQQRDGRVSSAQLVGQLPGLFGSGHRIPAAVHDQHLLADEWVISWPVVLKRRHRGEQYRSGDRFGVA
jgi:hypothetical protein